MTQAVSLSFSVGTPVHSAAISSSRRACRPRPIQEPWMKRARATAITTMTALLTNSILM